MVKKDDQAHVDATGDAESSRTAPTAVADLPKRIQRSRAKGWRMPEGAVYVGRPTKYGNPWSPDGYYDAGYVGPLSVAIAACIENYRAWMTRTRSSWTGDVPCGPLKHPDGSVYMDPVDVTPLRGKDLACWCPLDQPCHADVLLELANADGL